MQLRQHVLRLLLRHRTLAGDGAALPTIATTWVRTVRTIRSASRAALAGVASSWSSRAASSAAVIAGCLVATVKCNRWISTKPRP
jgi:hypothetical protein